MTSTTSTPTARPAPSATACARMHECGFFTVSRRSRDDDTAPVAPAPPHANATTGSADEPQRTAILDELRREPTGLDVSQLAVRIGLHPNTIRWHLGRLADAGLVRSTPAHRGRRGRPRIVYSATSGAAPAGESYRFLAELLASALARATEGQEAVEAAGRAWGGYLVERPAPSMPLTTDEAAGRIVDLLQAHGFAPQRVGDAIEMHRCPFQELVETYGNVVCGLHRGLLGGALDALDAGVELTALEPYPEPGLCRATFAAA